MGEFFRSEGTVRLHSFQNYLRLTHRNLLFQSRDYANTCLVKRMSHSDRLIRHERHVTANEITYLSLSQRTSAVQRILQYLHFCTAFHAVKKSEAMRPLIGCWMEQKKRQVCMAHDLSFVGFACCQSFLPPLCCAERSTTSTFQSNRQSDGSHIIPKVNKRLQPTTKETNGRPAENRQRTSRYLPRYMLLPSSACPTTSQLRRRHRCNNTAIAYSVLRQKSPLTRLSSLLRRSQTTKQKSHHHETNPSKRFRVTYNIFQLRLSQFRSLAQKDTRARNNGLLDKNQLQQ